MENKSLSFKIALAVIGTLCLAISINFIIGIDWGMSTFDTACYTTMQFFNVPKFGDAVLITHSFFLVLLVLFMKKLQSSWKHILIAVISILVVSRVINFFGFIIDIEYANNVVMFIVFLLSVVTVNLGIYLMATSSLVATPYDRFVIQLSAATNRDLGNARLIVDVVVFLIALAVIFIFKLDVPLSIATLFIVLISGPIITFWGKVLKF
ncbi:hypothetical protein RZE82_06680 [Mollicutes bacterium LVI A0039]|nr:hypothetical protein RZE82_06680 [Mollicutes bacterium LVI A0039]